MSAPFKLFSADQVPAGFRYPALLCEFAACGSYPAIYPWWFVEAESKAGRLMYSVRGHDGRALVPFAKVDDGRDDIACFDADDTTGDPRVLMLVLDESKRTYSFANFAAWLEHAVADAAR